MRSVKISNLGRVLLLNILVKIEKTGSSILAIKQIRDLIPKIGFNANEIEEMGIEENEDKSISWKSNKEVDYELGDAIYNDIKSELIKINETGKVNFQMLDFIERILTVDDFKSLTEEKKEVDNSDKN